MKLVVVGGGLAAMGLLWNVAKKQKTQKKFDKITWIASEDISSYERSPYYCSEFSTALIALQGIQKGVSPLGDLLVDAYFETLDFIETEAPEGVVSLKRFHLDHGEDCLKKFARRFSKINEAMNFNHIHLGNGVEEHGHSFNPKVFLSWFKKRILTDFEIEFRNHIVTDYDESFVYLHGEEKVPFDKLALCLGAAGTDFKSLNKDVSRNYIKAVGHYLAWSDVSFHHNGLGKESFTLTWKGHNLIYRHTDKSMVWGGSTYGDGITAPRNFDLKEDLRKLLATFPDFSFQGMLTTLSGVRSKPSKRAPIIDLSSDKRILSLNGFYKNGWTLCHHLGAQGAELLQF